MHTYMFRVHILRNMNLLQHNRLKMRCRLDISCTDVAAQRYVHSTASHNHSQSNCYCYWNRTQHYMVDFLESCICDLLAMALLMSCDLLSQSTGKTPEEIRKHFNIKVCACVRICVCVSVCLCMGASSLCERPLMQSLHSSGRPNTHSTLLSSCRFPRGTRF